MSEVIFCPSTVGRDKFYFEDLIKELEENGYKAEVFIPSTYKILGYARDLERYLKENKDKKMILVPYSNAFLPVIWALYECLDEIENVEKIVLLDAGPFEAERVDDIFIMLSTHLIYKILPKKGVGKYIIRRMKNFFEKKETIREFLAKGTTLQKDDERFEKIVEITERSDIFDAVMDYVKNRVSKGNVEWLFMVMERSGIEIKGVPCSQSYRGWMRKNLSRNDIFDTGLNDHLALISDPKTVAKYLLEAMKK